MKTIFKSIICLFFFSQNLLATNVSGTISSDATWTLTNSPYVVTGDVIIADQVTLTIEPGVVVEFNSTLRDLFIDGNIQAIGNSTDSIFFQGQGGVRGDVIIRNTGVLEVSTFAFCVFQDLSGNQASNSAVRLEIPTVFQNCRFSNNRDIIADADAVSGFENSNRLDDIRLLNNSLDSTTTFVNADSEGFYYQILGDLEVFDGDVLTIDPGVEIRFTSTLHEFYIGGKMIANGNATDSISIIGMNPNNGGIRILESGILDTSEFSYCNFSNLGSLVPGSAIEVYQPILLSHSTFNNNILDIKADGDFLFGIDKSNRLEEIRVLGNSLSTTTTWPSADDTGFKYSMLGDQTIFDNTTLTIEPGVIVEFPSALYEFFVNGQIIAEGTVNDSIRFVGEVNGEGGINLVSMGDLDTSLFKYCVFDSLGSLALNGASLIVNQPVLMSNCQFNSIRNIIADADFIWGINNTNRLDLIELYGSTLDSTTVWPNADETGFEYLTLGDQIVADDNILTIEAGTEIHFGSSLYEFFVNGQLIAEGTNVDSIKFIGDVVGAGGIQLTSLGNLDTSILSFCSFKDLGSIILESGLWVEHPALVSNCSFDNARDVIASADHVWGFEASNRLKEIEFLINSLTTTSHWPIADDTGFIYRMLGDLRVPAGEILTIEEGVEVLQNSTLVELFISGQINMMDDVLGKEVRFYRE